MSNTVEIDWSRLPTEFAYLRPIAEEYDRCLRAHRYDDRRTIESLTDEHITGLARVYEEIDRRGDAGRISLWLDSVPPDQQRATNGVYWPIFRMFSVFRAFGQMGKAPFDSQSVRYWVPDPPFDWRKLPGQLRYLAEPAEKFGQYHGDDEGEKFAEEHPEEMEELASVSERIRLQGDASAVFAWFKKYDPVKHPEAMYMMWMVNLMNEAGVPFED